MKKVNLLSKAEMKKVMGGNPPVGGGDGGGCSMHCRDKEGELIGQTVTVSNCEIANWDSHCTGVTGYDKSKSNCNCW